MKLHAEPLTALNTVTAYGPGFVEINKIRHSGHVLVSPEQPVVAWQVGGFDGLRAEDFAAVAALAPEVVLVGTGVRQRFVSPALTAGLTRTGVGVECMSTDAACRTYNILMSEGRRVVAAILQEP